jgi:hypothetical protein
MIVLRTGYLLWVLTCIPDSAMSQAARSRPAVPQLMPTHTDKAG